jgi:exosortase A-associated hydrolase 2
MQALFLDPASPGAGRCFAVLHPATGRPRGAVLHVPAFAEEMNKSRRMVAQQARQLAALGHDTLVLDLPGCGDSELDLGDVGWDDWLAVVVQAAQWLATRHGPGTSQPLTLWALRAGAPLAAQAAARLAGSATPVQRMLLWQPASAGKAALGAFLRLATAGALASGSGAGAARPAADNPRQQLARGETVEVAGYRIAPALATGFDAAALAPVRGVTQLAWLECGPREEPALAPATAAALQAWRDAGCAVQAQPVRGPAFWQTTEIEVAPALLQATDAAVAAFDAQWDAAPPQARPAAAPVAASSAATATHPAATPAPTQAP